MWRLGPSRTGGQASKRDGSAIRRQRHGRVIVGGSAPGRGSNRESCLFTSRPGHFAADERSLRTRVSCIRAPGQSPNGTTDTGYSFRHDGGFEVREGAKN
jgi:hypothetical protein